MKPVAFTLVGILTIMAVGTGCCSSAQWDDLPGATITPVAPDDVSALWASHVTAAVNTWNAGLEALSCSRPFVIGSGGHTVTLVDASAWTYPGAIGLTYYDDTPIIKIKRGDKPGQLVAESRYGAVMHELGHALGLGHANPDFGPSIMAPPHEWDIYPRDLAAAACKLSCGPCDPNGDHYDRN